MNTPDVNTTINNDDAQAAACRPNPRRVAARKLVKTGKAAHMLRRLEKAERIVRKGRAARIAAHVDHLEAKLGSEKAAEMRAKFEARASRKPARVDVLAGLTDDEIATLIDLLTKIETPLYAALGEKVADRHLRGHGPRGSRGGRAGRGKRCGGGHGRGQERGHGRCGHKHP